MNAKDMGMFICKLRKENNMTQMELAQQLHVTDKAVSRWERGVGYPDIQLLPALSESLHVSVAELISCKKSLNYSNEEVTNIIHNLDVYKMESFRQDRKADKISLVCMIFVAACVYISGHGSIELTHSGECGLFFIKLSSSPDLYSIIVLSLLFEGMCCYE